MQEAIRLVQVGCGPIGCTIARLAVSRRTLNVVGAVDIDPGKVGRDLGDLVGLETKLDLIVSDDMASVIGRARPDIVVHTTGSSIEAIHEQLEQIICLHANVVSTCEELAFPHGKNARLGKRIDRLAKEHGVTVLGTGINPGFLMDAWPLFMSGVCQEVDVVRITRMQDASSRRLPFQRKIGAGLTYDEFRKRVDEGTLRHVGLTESMSMVASGLGWQLDRIEERIEPVFADRRISTPYLTVEPGSVAGVKQTAWGVSNGKARIVLEFLASVGVRDAYDEVVIQGIPELRVRVVGGTHGDIGTAAIVANVLPRVVEAQPGLLTMRDVPMAVCGN